MGGLNPRPEALPRSGATRRPRVPAWHQGAPGRAGGVQPGRLGRPGPPLRARQYDATQRIPAVGLIRSGSEGERMAKKQAKKAAAGAESDLGFEAQLWGAADALRNDRDAAE